MAQIAPKDLASAVAAAKPGDRLELGAGELVGQVVIDKPLVIEGRGPGTWLGNRTGPVLIIRSSGVELRDLQVELTGDLQHPAILVEGDRELVRRNVTIRRGELRVERPRLRFATPPPIRLKEQTPPVPPRTVPPRPPPGRAPTQPPARAPTQPPARAPTQPPAVSAPVPPSSPMPPPATPGGSGVIGPRWPRRVYAGVGIVLAGIVLVLFAALGHLARSRQSSDPGRDREPGALADAGPPVEEVALAGLPRTSIEVVGWSEDEERFVLALAYGRDGAEPARWRVRAVVDAPSEKVLQWQDLSGPQARVVAGEEGWPAPDLHLPIDGFGRGSVIDPSQLRVQWCEKEAATRFPTAVGAAGQDLEITWGSSGPPYSPAQCPPNEAGVFLVLASDGAAWWRVMRYWPRSKEARTFLRVYASPSRRRAVVVTLDREDDRAAAHFWTRLLGPQIYILSGDEAVRRDLLRRLGRPGLFLGEREGRGLDLASSTVLVPAGDEAAYEIGAALAVRLGFGIERTEDKHVWSDVLIVPR